jgi:AraC family transcriptional regulator, regulatory protein of adaptative response / methylated-DNA-[protein]-cysteine methyltransferase
VIITTMPTSALFSAEIATPLGPMFAIASDRGLVLCEFTDRPMLPTQLERVKALFGELPPVREHEYLRQTERELGEYFTGTRETFTVPLVLDGTPFQTNVWRELLAIPFGTTTSYERLATKIGRPGAARAVGRANGDNRMAIIVPCHRVINADGSLSGYGGGRRRKEWLLTHEQRGLQLPMSLLDSPTQHSHSLNA